MMLTQDTQCPRWMERVPFDEVFLLGSDVKTIGITLVKIVNLI